MTRLYLLFILLILLQAASVSVAEEDDDFSEPFRRTPVDWSLVDFEDDYVLTKLRIERRRNTGMDYRNGKVIADIVVTDKDVLRRFAGALKSSRINAPSKYEGYSGLTPHGKLECETNQGKFVVFWNDCFVLNEETPSSHNSFWSPETALTIDKLLRDNGKEGLEEKELRYLTGEETIRIIRKQFGRE